jgi:hypothetical protein
MFRRATNYADDVYAYLGGPDDLHIRSLEAFRTWGNLMKLSRWQLAACRGGFKPGSRGAEPGTGALPV